VVERDTVLELQLAIDHFEAGIGHGVGVRIADVAVCCADIADHGTGCVLGHRAVVEGNVGCCLIYIADADVECLRAAQATGIRRRDINRHRV